MSFKGLDTSPTLELTVATRTRELPHLDCLVQAAAHEITAVGRKRHAVNTVLVPVWAFKAFAQVTSLNVPNANALVERAGSNVLGIGRDGDRGHPVFDAQDKNHAASLDVPKSHGTVSTA